MKRKYLNLCSEHVILIINQLSCFQDDDSNCEKNIVHEIATELHRYVVAVSHYGSGGPLKRRKRRAQLVPSIVSYATYRTE